MPRRFGLHLAFILSVLTLVQTTSADTESCEPTLIENFEGQLNPTRWRVVEGNGCAVGLCGWGNNEVQHYSSQAVQVVDGALSITVTEEDGRVTSGKLASDGLFSQQYGRFAARIKLPRGRGLWPAFWMMPLQFDQFV